MKFKSDIEVQAGLKDSSGALGLSGQILSSTSGNVSWVTPTVNTVARDVQNEVKAGVAINKGQAVYVTGADGTNIIVGLASNATEATSSKTLGLLNATVAVNGFADVVQIGRLSGLNTLGATAGDPVWLGTGGNLIYGLINKPYAPAHLVFIGIVTRVNVNNGEIFVSVQNGFELNEIHDVDLKTTVPINGDILGYDGTLWVNKTIAQWLGYTPANASGTTNYVSKFTGTTTLGNSQIFDNGTNVGIGTVSPTSKLQVLGTGRAFNVSSSTDQVAASFGCGSGAVSTIGFYGLGSSNDYNVRIGANLEALVMYAGDTERMRIAFGGNVGIGTSAPGSKLNIEGGFLRVNGTEADNYFFEGVRTGISTTLRIYDNSSNIFYDSYSSMLFRANQNGGSGGYIGLFGGNVGIGTGTPNTILSVVKTETFNGYTDFVQLADNTNGLRISDYWDSSGIRWDLRRGTTPMMSFSQSNNVGIGTTNPDVKFQVQGGTIKATTGDYASPSTGGAISMFQDNNDYGTIWSVKNYNGAWGNIAIAPLGGNVGIGTTSPAVKLDVNGAINLLNGDNLTWGGSYGAGIPTIVGYNDGSGGSLYFYPSGNTSGEKMRILANGNVGIGTTAPGDKLVISGTNVFARVSNSSVGDGGIKISYQNSDTHGLHLLYNPGSAISYIDNTYPVSSGQVYGDIYFRQNVGGTMTPRMSIKADSGNVGIGTSSPSQKLDVNGSAYIANDFWTTGDNGLWFNNGSYTGGITGRVGGSEVAIFAGSSERVRFASNGNVGIGTTTPTQKLDVVGNAKVSGSVQVGDDSATASATNVGATRYRSDANNSYMDMVMQTGASTYAWVNVVQNTWI